MKLSNVSYEAALEIFEQAVKAFSRGDRVGGEKSLAGLDIAAIEVDRCALRDLARTARLAETGPTEKRASRTIPRVVKDAVARRDHYHCRFTGRRLIDTRVLQEAARISNVFHFDAHHSVRETRRGPEGHPIVRTHGAAYEHVEPHSCGGHPTVENIYHICVELNESKGARILDQVDLPEGAWDGMVGYLSALQLQTSGEKSPSKAVSVLPTPRRKRVRGPVIIGRRNDLLGRIREAGVGLSLKVFALEDGLSAEEEFLSLRRLAENSYFATQTKIGTWSIHRMHCSSLAFNGTQKLTARPKVCAERREDLAEWARRFGVLIAPCSRCPKPKYRR